MIYSHLSLQPYFRPRENISLDSQRKIFALRGKISNIEANFCSTNKIKKCDKCNFVIDKYYLFKCTRQNIKNITYDQILHGNILEQKNVIQFLNENEVK